MYTGDEDKTFAQGVTFVVLASIIGKLASIVILAITAFVINVFEISNETMKISKQLMYAMAIVAIFQAVEMSCLKQSGVLKGY